MNGAPARVQEKKAFTIGLRGKRRSKRFIINNYYFKTMIDEIILLMANGK
jgi:hypothetical protein